MDVDLPSGSTVKMRDKLIAKDKFAVQAAIRLSTDTATGLQETQGGLVNDMRNALLKRVIISDTPVTDEWLSELDIDDYNALAEAVEPFMSKIITSPNRRGQSSSS